MTVTLSLIERSFIRYAIEEWKKGYAWPCEQATRCDEILRKIPQFADESVES
jgi:hypothetical protein